MLIEIHTSQGELLFSASQEDHDSWDVATYDAGEQTSFGTTDTDGALAAASVMVRRGPR